MINIQDKHQCCGCCACVQKCPKQSISLQEDNEGFLYPHVNTETCIDCGLCEKVCPILHPYKACEPLQTLAAINKDEKIRMESSSGGVFTLLAEPIIREGGVVFGARFDEEWQVTLDYTETIEGLAAFRGSKYVQARTGETYKQCEKFLKAGRKVLYTGTPCQIAGLHHYLRNEYENLLAVECVCHSVPSPIVWRMYLEQHRKNRIVRNINFRDKSLGWSYYKYSLVIDYENGDTDIIPGGQPYMKALVANLSTRPSCSFCQARDGRSGADLSIGDFWGAWNINPQSDDNKGTTIIIAYSDKGLSQLEGHQVWKVSISDAAVYNQGLCGSEPLHPNRIMFFNKLKGCDSVDTLIENSLHLTILEKLKRKIKSI